MIGILLTCQTDAKAAADRLARQVAKAGYENFECVYAHSFDLQGVLTF